MEDDVIEGYLRRRQYRALKKNPRDSLIFPPNCDPQNVDAIYQLLKRYSFRLFLRDCIKHRRDFSISDVRRFCSERTAAKYLQFLLRSGIVEGSSEDRFHLRDGVLDLGDTFEWFIAEVLEREFLSPACWGVRIAGTRCGGDFDVLAVVEGRFLYIEAKTSPPKHIDKNNISSYMDKIEELRPDFSFFIEDTHLRMKDKIVQLFSEEIRRRGGKDLPRGLLPCRLRDEIFCIGDRIYILNSKPDIINNIGFCLKHFLGRGWRWLENP